MGGVYSLFCLRKIVAYLITFSIAVLTDALKVLST
jgi:hypothetical protein